MQKIINSISKVLAYICFMLIPLIILNLYLVLYYNITSVIVYILLLVAMSVYLLVNKFFIRRYIPLLIIYFTELLIVLTFIAIFLTRLF